MSMQHPDRRTSPRKRTLLGGKVVYSEGSFSSDCTIRNISQTGARITLPENGYMPLRIFLVATSKAIAYEASIAWTKGNDFGLRFLKAASPTGKSPATAHFLKHLGTFDAPL